MTRRRKAFWALMSTRTRGTGGSSPGGIPGLIVWLKADSLALADNDRVTNWADQSGVGNNFDHSMGDQQQPFFHTNQINGLPAVYFQDFSNAGIDMSAAWKPSVPTSGECFCVCKADNDPAALAHHGGLWSFGTSGFSDHVPYTDGTIFLGWGRTIRPSIGNPTPALNVWRRLNVWTAPNDYSFQIDAVTFYFTLVNTVGFKNNPSFSAGATGVVYAGHIAEYIQYNRKLTAVERTKIDDYLKAKYALT